MSTPAISLGNIPFFAELPATDLMAIMKFTETRQYGWGEMIFAQEDIADGLYLVLSGRVQIQVVLVRSGKRKIIADCGPGDYVGEFGLIDGQPRSASVISAEPSQVLFLPAKAFVVIMQTRPSVAIGVRKKLGEIVRKRTGRNIPYTEGHIPDVAELQELARILRDYNTQVLSTL